MCDGLCTYNKQKQSSEAVERKEKRRKSVEKAIPNIADAIRTVVNLSKNEDFKKKCLHLSKVKDDEQLYEALKNKLWKVASCRLNIQQSEENKSQIVPDDQPTKDNAVEASTGDPEKYAIEKGGVEDYFDDLARDISLYEDPSSSEKCPQATTDHGKHKTIDALEFSKDSSFEFLAELHWDLSEENLSSGVQVHGCKVANHTAHPRGCISKVQGTKQGSVVPTQELQCSVKERENDSFPTVTTADVTSPKAKLRCHEKSSTLKEENKSSNDWLKEFTQDSFWLADKNTPENLKSEPSLMTSKEKAIICGVQSPFNINSSERVKFKDDFDDLAEFSVI